MKAEKLIEKMIAEAVDKKIAILKRKAMAKIKCPKGQSPHIVSSNGTKFKFKCKPIDKELAKRMSKIAKKFAKSGAAKKARAKAAKTRAKNTN